MNPSTKPCDFPVFATTVEQLCLGEGEARGVVAGVFRRAANLLMDDGRLLCVLHPTGDVGPGAVVLEQPLPLEEAMRPGDPVRVTDTLLEAGALRVATALAATADSTVAPEGAGALPDPEAAAALRRMVAQRPDRSGAAGELLRQRLQVLCTALAWGDDPAPAAAGLVGLGFGLTPSGDDMLTGMLLTLRFAGVVSPAKALGDAVLDRLSATTQVSRWMLRNAAAGRCRRSLLLVLRSLWANRGLEASAQALFAVGASSGLDTARGVLAARDLLWLSARAPVPPTEQTQ